MNKKRRRLIIAGAVAVILLLLFVLGYHYVNDYYPADAQAVECIDNPEDGISIAYGDDNELIFTPEEETGIGLIFYPGGKVEYQSYAPLMCRLAQKGITCILVDMPLNLAILGVNRADGIQERHPEIDSWYIGGHSLGGTAASMYLGKHADDYKGLILLGSYTSADLSKTSLSVLSLYGSEDGVMNRQKYEDSKTKLPADFTEIVIEGGCHAGFGNYGRQDGDGTAAISSEEQQEITAEAVWNFVNGSE